MTVHLGAMTTYTNTEPNKRAVTDRLIMASPYDITSILALGLDNVGKFRFKNEPGTKYEWLEDQYPTRTDTSTADHFTDTTNTTSMIPTTPALYKAGDVIKVDSELIYVLSNTGVYLNLTRGFDGTTPVTHTTSSVVTIVYSARLEGATGTDDSPTHVVTTGVNYSTILQWSIEVSRSDQMIKKYGVADLKEYYISRAMEILQERLARLPYYGVVNAGNATTLGRSSGGFNSFISTTHTTCSSAALTQKDIDDALAAAWSYGGQPDMLFCGSWAKRKINSFYEKFVTTERSETMGGINITTLEHPLGGKPIRIIVDRQCQSDYIYLIDSRYCGFITLDPFFYEDLAKTKDADVGQVVGEYGFVCAFQKAHAVVHTFSVTA